MEEVRHCDVFLYLMCQMVLYYDAKRLYKRIQIMGMILPQARHSVHFAYICRRSEGDSCHKEVA